MSPQQEVMHMPDPVNSQQPLAPKNSFADELESSLDNLMEELASLISPGLRVVPDSEAFGLRGLSQIPDEEMVISGRIEGASNFLEDLMGSAVWECTLYVQPLAEVYQERGIRKPEDRFGGTSEALAEFDDALLEATAQCSFVLALRIHTLNYLMKGDLKRGVTWQGWEL